MKVQCKSLFGSKHENVVSLLFYYSKNDELGWNLFIFLFLICLIKQVPLKTRNIHSSHLSIVFPLFRDAWFLMECCADHIYRIFILLLHQFFSRRMHRWTESCTDQSFQGILIWWRDTTMPLQTCQEYHSLNLKKQASKLPR